jgi:hypothetical protein
VTGSAASPAAVILHGMPTATYEWRLVTVSGRVVSVHKLGERWRAELLVGTQQVVVVGQPGAGIPQTSIVEGRTATVTGIARRPDPSASDHRFVVTPRFPADLRLTGSAATGSAASPGRGADKGSTGGTGAPRPGTSTEAGPLAPTASAALDADLIDLDAHVGAVVRVGGLVVDLRTDGFSLDDGTAIGHVVVRGGALDLLPLIEPDDALNAIGRVERTADGLVIAVEDPSGLVLTGDPVAAESPPAAVQPADIADPTASDHAPAANRLADLGGASLPGGAGAAGLGGLIAISGLSLAVTLLRRQQARRRFAARIAGRLAALAAPAGGPPEPSAAERDPSTNHSA